jgi:hypothetical protein
MTSFSVTSFKNVISEFQEDSIQIPTQKSPILCFHLDGLVMRLDAYKCQEASEQLQVTSVRTSWQHVRMLFRVREDSNFHLQTRIGKIACICPDTVLDKEFTCIQFATVRTLRQHRPDSALIWRA